MRTLGFVFFLSFFFHQLPLTAKNSERILTDTTLSKTAPDSSSTITPEVINLGVAYVYTAENTEGFGLKYNYIMHSKRFPRNGIGLSIFYEIQRFRDAFQFPKNVIKSSISYTAPGITFHYRASHCIYVQAGVSGIIGTEKLTTTFYENSNLNPYGPPVFVIKDRKQINTFTGFQFEQNIFFIKPQRTGLTLGFGLFQRAVNTFYYDTDIGVKLYFGFYL